MRVIAGIARGRKLISKDIKGTRPTLDRVKESLFNILGYPLNGLLVLDLFSGTGNLGIEALSRGADKVVFVDNNLECYKLINKNINILGFEERSDVLKADAESFLSNTNMKFDIILMDPPYKNIDLIFKVIKIVNEGSILKQDGLLVIEHDNKFKPIVLPNDQRKYGSTYLSFYSKEKLLELSNENK